MPSWLIAGRETGLRCSSLFCGDIAHVFIADTAVVRGPEELWGGRLGKPRDVHLDTEIFLLETNHNQGRSRWWRACWWNAGSHPGAGLRSARQKHWLG